jgi:hypothetical protein
MVKSVLVTGGGPKWPNGDKLKGAGLKRLYYEANNPELDAAFFQQLRDWGYEVGVMRDPVWNDYSSTPEQFIAQVNGDIARFAPKKPNGTRPQLAVMLDIERHDPDYVVRALQEFKRTQPGRNVCWTLEFHQAGWFSDELVRLVNTYGNQLKVLPQLYLGSMDAVVDSHAAARDMARVNDERLAFFYSCRVPLPIGWDGCAYLESWAQLP